MYCPQIKFFFQKERTKKMILATAWLFVFVKRPQLTQGSWTLSECVAREVPWITACWRANTKDICPALQFVRSISENQLGILIVKIATILCCPEWCALSISPLYSIQSMCFLVFKQRIDLDYFDLKIEKMFLLLSIIIVTIFLIKIIPCSIHIYHNSKID